MRVDGLTEEERRRNVLGSNKRYVFDAVAGVHVAPPMAALPALMNCPVRYGPRQGGSGGWQRGGRQRGVAWSGSKAGAGHKTWRYDSCPPM